MAQFMPQGAMSVVLNGFFAAMVGYLITFSFIDYPPGNIVDDDSHSGMAVTSGQKELLGPVFCTHATPPYQNFSVHADLPHKNERKKGKTRI